jgi:hypothetical protein
MVDFILFVFLLVFAGVCFYAGVYVGKTYGSIKKFYAAIGKRISDTADD